MDTEHHVSMDFEIPRPEIIRSMPLWQVFANAGKVFDNAGSLLGALPGKAEYDKSNMVTSIDGFLSHSWRGNLWLKWLALILHFRTFAAVVASQTFAALMLMLQWYLGNDARVRRVHGAMPHTQEAAHSERILHASKAQCQRSPNYSCANYSGRGFRDARQRLVSLGSQPGSRDALTVMSTDLTLRAAVQ